MRVLVVSDRLGSHDPVEMSVLLGRAWRQAGAQVAAVGLTSVDDGDPDRHDWWAAHDALPDDDTFYFPLTGDVNDGAHHMFEALTPLLAESATSADVDWSRMVGQLKNLVDDAPVGVCSVSSAELVLTGPAGLAGRRPDLDLRARLTFDRNLSEWAENLMKAARLCDVDASHIDDLGRMPGSGAGAGLGAVMLAAGGHVKSGIQVLGELAELEKNMGKADLVVTSCDTLDIDHYGTETTEYVAKLAEKTERPVVLVARKNYLNESEQRDIGIQAVREIGESNDVTADCVAFARTWVW